MKRKRSLLVRNRDFRHLFAAEVVMFGGNWFVAIPLVILLLDLTGGGFWGGMVLALETGITALLLPYTGVIADRVNRRNIMLGANVATIVAVLALLLVRSSSTVWIALVATSVSAVAKALYSPAANAALPNLVRREDLAEANVFSGSVWGTMLVVGSSLGGLAAARFGPYPCFLIDVVCLVAAAVLVWRVRGRTQSARSHRARARPRQDVAEAVGFISGRPLVLSLVTVKMAVALGNGVLTVFPVLVTTVFQVGPAGMGLVFAARGLGAMLGPVLLRRVLRGRGHLLHAVLALSMVVYGISYLGVSCSPWYLLALPLVTLAHIAGGGNWAMSNVALQSVVPDVLRGRVFATDVMMATVCVSLSQLSAGLVIDYVNPRWVVMGCASITLMYGLVWSLATRRVAARDIERLAHEKTPVVSL